MEITLKCSALIQRLALSHPSHNNRKVILLTVTIKFTYVVIKYTVLNNIYYINVIKNYRYSVEPLICISLNIVYAQWCIISLSSRTQ